MVKIKAIDLVVRTCALSLSLSLLCSCVFFMSCHLESMIIYHGSCLDHWYELPWLFLVSGVSAVSLVSWHLSTISIFWENGPNFTFQLIQTSHFLLDVYHAYWYILFSSLKLALFIYYFNFLLQIRITRTYRLPSDGDREFYCWSRASLGS